MRHVSPRPDESPAASHPTPGDVATRHGRPAVRSSEPRHGLPSSRGGSCSPPRPRRTPRPRGSQRKGVGPHQHAPRAAPTVAANLEIDRELATLLALEAVGMYGGDDIPPEVDEILRRAVPAVSIDTEPIFGSGIDSFRFSPDKDAVALVGADGSLGVWNLVTGARRFALRSPAVTCSFLIGCPDFFRIALSDDGSLPAAGDAEGARPRVGPRLRARGPHRLRSRRSAGRKAWRSCSSPGCHQPDERFLATGGGDGAIRLWDIVTGGSVEHPDGNGEESDRPSPALGLRAVAIVLRSRRNPLVHRWPAALRRGCRQRANARLVEGSVLACRGRGPIQVPPGIRPPNGTGPPGRLHIRDARRERRAGSCASKGHSKGYSKVFERSSLIRVLKGYSQLITEVVFSEDGRDSQQEARTAPLVYGT